MYEAFYQQACLAAGLHQELADHLRLVHSLSKGQADFHTVVQLLKDFRDYLSQLQRDKVIALFDKYLFHSQQPACFDNQDFIQLVISFFGWLKQDKSNLLLTYSRRAVLALNRKRSLTQDQSKLLFIAYRILYHQYQAVGDQQRASSILKQWLSLSQDIYGLTHFKTQQIRSLLPGPNKRKRASIDSQPRLYFNSKRKSTNSSRTKLATQIGEVPDQPFIISSHSKPAQTISKRTTPSRKAKMAINNFAHELLARSKYLGSGRIESIDHNLIKKVNRAELFHKLATRPYAAQSKRSKASAASQSQSKTEQKAPLEMSSEKKEEPSLQFQKFRPQSISQLAVQGQIGTKQARGFSFYCSKDGTVLWNFLRAQLYVQRNCMQFVFSNTKGVSLVCRIAVPSAGLTLQQSIRQLLQGDQPRVWHLNSNQLIMRLFKLSSLVYKPVGKCLVFKPNYSRMSKVQQYFNADSYYLKKQLVSRVTDPFNVQAKRKRKRGRRKASILLELEEAEGPRRQTASRLSVQRISNPFPNERVVLVLVKKWQKKYYLVDLAVRPHRAGMINIDLFNLIVRVSVYDFTASDKYLDSRSAPLCYDFLDVPLLLFSLLSSTKITQEHFFLNRGFGTAQKLAFSKYLEEELVLEEGKIHLPQRKKKTRRPQAEAVKKSAPAADSGCEDTQATAQSLSVLSRRSQKGESLHYYNSVQFLSFPKFIYLRTGGLTNVAFRLEKEQVRVAVREGVEVKRRFLNKEKNKLAYEQCVLFGQSLNQGLHLEVIRQSWLHSQRVDFGCKRRGLNYFQGARYQLRRHIASAVLRSEQFKQNLHFMSRCFKVEQLRMSYRINGYRGNRLFSMQLAKISFIFGQIFFSLSLQVSTCKTIKFVLPQDLLRTFRLKPGYSLHDVGTTLQKCFSIMPLIFNKLVLRLPNSQTFVETHLTASLDFNQQAYKQVYTYRKVLNFSGMLVVASLQILAKVKLVLIRLYNKETACEHVFLAQFDQLYRIQNQYFEQLISMRSFYDKINNVAATQRTHYFQIDRLAVRRNNFNILTIQEQIHSPESKVLFRSLSSPYSIRLSKNTKTIISCINNEPRHKTPAAFKADVLSIMLEGGPTSIRHQLLARFVNSMRLIILGNTRFLQINVVLLQFKNTLATTLSARGLSIASLQHQELLPPKVFSHASTIQRSNFFAYKVSEVNVDLQSNRLTKGQFKLADILPKSPHKFSQGLIKKNYVDRLGEVNKRGRTSGAMPIYESHLDLGGMMSVLLDLRQNCFILKSCKLGHKASQMRLPIQKAKESIPSVQQFIAQKMLHILGKRIFNIYKEIVSKQLSG